MIIGITGTDGAGKGTVVQYLVDKKDYTHYSSRDLLLAEMKQRNVPFDRNHMRLVANELRATHGSDFIPKQAYSKIKASKVTNAVIESIRAIAEAEYIKAQGGLLIAVDADVTERFRRVQARRSESDKVDFETFVRHEELEKNDPDPHGMQKAAVIKMADFVIYNDGTIDELQQQVDDILEQIQ